ncbi:hypothetical protein Tco_0773833 [Tanacetum coccineum]|uniref:Uncharacterized protein n=1 Tax=Tanacetum coccineum TaxID=301880 RepID=A0ABQ4ZQJ3_9ASTR
MSMEALQAQRTLYDNRVKAFSKSLSYSFGEKPKVLLHAWTTFIELSTAQPEEVQELLTKLVQGYEYQGVPKVCDVPFHNNSPPLDISKDQSEDFSSTDEDSFSSNDVEYVEASPPNSEPVSSKVMEIVIPEVGRIEDDILLIKDDTLREKLLNVNRLVAKIEALKDNPFQLRCCDHDDLHIS